MGIIQSIENMKQSTNQSQMSRIETNTKEGLHLAISLSQLRKLTNQEYFNWLMLFFCDREFALYKPALKQAKNC